MVAVVPLIAEAPLVAVPAPAAVAAWVAEALLAVVAAGAATSCGSAARAMLQDRYEQVRGVKGDTSGTWFELADIAEGADGVVRDVRVRAHDRHRVARQRVALALVLRALGSHRQGR